MKKAIMFTAKHMSPERVRFEKAIAASTLAIKEVYVTFCVWDGDDLVYEGGQTFYQNLYFWICGYGDGLAVIEAEIEQKLGHAFGMPAANLPA